MPRFQFPALLVALSFPAACATSSNVSVAPRLATIPQSLTLGCPDVVDLPSRDIAMDEAVRLWAKDRQSLGTCRDRHAALSAAAKALQDQGKHE